MWRAISFLQKNLIWSIPTTMLAGLLFGYYFDCRFLQAAIIPFTILMVYPMMVNLNIGKLFSRDNSLVQLIAQSINFAFIPFLGLGIGKLFFADKPLIILGLLLTALLPTSGMTISWTGFAKGNISAAIRMTVIGLIIGSILTPLYLQFLLGTVIFIPLIDVFRQILIVVFIPMFAGYATQRMIIRKYGLEKYHQNLKQKFPKLSTLGVLGIVFIAMSLKSETIISNPSELFSLFVPLILLYSANFLLSTVIGKLFFRREDAIALVYGTVMRNLSIALAIAMTAFGKQGAEIALIIAVGYIIQVQTAAWYVKFTDKIFGSIKPAAG